MKSHVQTSFLNRAGFWTQLLPPTPGLAPSFLGFSPPHRPFQPQLDPEPMDPLEIHRPAPAVQHRVDSPVSESGVSPGQAFDLPDQGRLVGSVFPIVSQGRSRSPDHAAGPPLRDLVLLGQVARGGSLLVGGHHFFCDITLRDSGRPLFLLSLIASRFARRLVLPESRKVI